MVLKSFPVISVKGKPFECGRQHGSQARELIRKNVDLYFHLWGDMWGAKRPEIIEKCHNFIPVIGEYDADILEELQGIAKGTDLSLEEIIALNARYELLWGERVTRQFRPGGCTSMAALPGVTKDGHTIAGQNWDTGPVHFDYVIILEVEQEGKPKVFLSTEAGLIGLKGMNSAGLGLCANCLVSNLDRFEPGVPFFIMIRKALNAENFTRSMQAILTAKTNVSGNVLMAHQDGEAIDFEVTPEDVGIVHDEEGILTHSNHFLAFTNRADFKDLFKRFAPSTLFRYHRARRLLELDKGSIDIDSFKRVFSDHFSYPDSICWHVNPRDSKLGQIKTVNSIIMDLKEGAMYITEGNPCQNEYVKLTPFS
ncbi:C45 family autoproteolytic acyltransferase/hydrolase [Chloroflexota bacterium]